MTFKNLEPQLEFKNMETGTYGKLNKVMLFFGVK